MFCKQNRDRLIDGEQMTASGGMEKKEKGVMDKDNSGVVAGGEEYKGLYGNGKNIIKII